MKRAKEKSNLTQILEQEHKKDRGGFPLQVRNTICCAECQCVVIASRSSFLSFRVCILIKYTSAFAGHITLVCSWFLCCVVLICRVCFYVVFFVVFVL